MLLLWIRRVTFTATGETTSANFPVLNPLQASIGGGDDAFVCKFNSAGARLYSTFLGGIENDRATAVAVDASGFAYVTGSTYSPNFPTLNAFQARLGGGQDAFAAKIGVSSNSLIYSTYLGGSGGTASAPETGNGIAVDSNGFAYGTGTTSSSNFPTLNPLQSVLGAGEDAFVVKLSAVGNALVYSTYLGGSSVDFGNAITIDSIGKAYIAGYTTSTDFPVVNANQGSRRRLRRFCCGSEFKRQHTRYGHISRGTGSDSANCIVVDMFGEVYVAGQTLSTNFTTNTAVQIHPGAGAAAFVAEIGFNPANPQLISPAAGTHCRQALPT